VKNRKARRAVPARLAEETACAVDRIIELMKPAASHTVADYIAGFPRPVQIVLRRVRSIIRRAVPGAEEVISYSIPCFKLHRKPVLFFAAWKEHFSLYPSSRALVAAFKRELAGYELSKGTIRFPLSEPVPARLIERIAKFRAREVARMAKPQTAAKKKR
jgi:uncharacterized protein YdhG (YjbR/CyaY superfamily)